MEISVEPDDVYDFILDLEHLEDTQEDFVLLSEPFSGPLSIGDRWTVLTTVLDDQFEVEREIIEANRPNSMEWASASPYGSEYGIYTLEGTSTGTKVTHHVESTLPDGTSEKVISEIKRLHNSFLSLVKNDLESV